MLLSAKSGVGMDAWVDWLLDEVQAGTPAAGASAPATETATAVNSTQAAVPNSVARRRSPVARYTARSKTSPRGRSTIGPLTGLSCSADSNARIPVGS